MAEVTIKAHTRRGKGGKVVQVHSYSRRVGRKGVHSPKRKKSEQPGEELEQKMEMKKPPVMSPSELAAERRRIQEWEDNFRRMEAERKSLGMSREKYSRYRLGQLKKRKGYESSEDGGRKFTATHSSTKGSLGVLEKVEDKVAKFVEKYSGKKYKRQL